MDIIEAIKSRREWWILRDAFQIEPEVRTIAHLSVTYIDFVCISHITVDFCAMKSAY